MCIIGHSLADSDLRLVLQAAKETSSPDHPIFMIATGFTRGMQREFYERYNIAVVPYDNRDGTHGQLKRILIGAGRYIPKRGEIAINHAPSDPAEAEAAMALLLFRRLQEANAEAPPGLFAPLVLQAVAKSSSTPVLVAELIGMPPLSTIPEASSRTRVREAVDAALGVLVPNGLVILNGDTVELLAAGKGRLQEVAVTREIRT